MLFCLDWYNMKERGKKMRKTGKSIYALLLLGIIGLGAWAPGARAQADKKQAVQTALKEPGSKKTSAKELVFIANKQKVDELVKAWPGTSREAAQAMIAKYGHPDEATDNLLLWRNNGVWKQTVVYREEVQHNFPVPHHDVLQQSINMNVPPNKVSELLAFDGSLLVDRTKGELAARCDQEAMNFLALNLAYDIIMGNKTADEARSFYTKTAKAFLKGEEDEYTQKLNFVPEKITGDKDDVQVMEIIDDKN